MTSTDPAQGLAPSLHIEDGVATLCLRRPRKMNRLTTADLLCLQQHCEHIDADASVRVAVLTADTSGQKQPVFCAGYDVGGFEDAGHDPDLFERCVDRLAALRPVLICALNGSVFGGATDMVLASDLRIGLPHLSFRMPAVALGLHYYPSGLQRYVQVLGLERARQAFLTARPFSSEQLIDFGVLLSLHEAPDFGTALQQLVSEVRALAPLAAQATKRSLTDIACGRAQVNDLRERQSLTLRSSDFAEGRIAFAERRTPRFQGA